MAEQNEKSVIVPIEFQGGDNTPAVYANNVLIQHTDNEFVITFFEILPPLLSPDPERQEEEIARIKSIPARPVAKVVMAAGPAMQFQEAMRDNVGRFLSRDQASKDGE
jgi:hypothetical protein